MTAPAPIQPGTIIGGDFRVVAPLAAGGMGALYVAEQLSIGKQRALKVMHPSLVADPGMRERFVQEARVGAMVPSDHVVEVLGAGIDPTLGVPWLAMELLTGEDLAQHVARRGPLSPGELPDILRPLCHALGAAHSRGIVHRDVKPENVFLASTMSSTHPMIVKVLDFGIAKVAAQARGDSTAAMGTPMWMAPEQTELRSRVSPATDVWPLGLIAFWLLTGKVYWHAGQDALGASVPQLMREILFEPLEPPSARARALGSHVVLPPAFDTWFARCVQRDPTQRFQNASEAANALFHEVLGAGAHVSVPPPPDPSGPSWPVQSQPVPGPPSGSSPTAPTLHGPALETAPAAVLLPKQVARRSMLLPVLLVGGLLLGVVLVMGAIGARYFFLTQASEAAPTQAPTPASASALTATSEPARAEPQPTAVGAASPSVRVGTSPSPKGSAGSAGSAKPEPTPSAAPSASAAPSKGPFDATAAASAVAAKASWAQTACRSREGPAGLSGTVVYRPTGTVLMVTAPFKDEAAPRTGCVRSILYSAIIKPFDGSQTQSVPYSVSF